MAVFYYRAVGRDGKTVDGTLEAAGQELASRQLRARGLTLLSLKSDEAGSAVGRSGGRPPSRQDVLSMTTELAVLLRAGLPLDRSLKVLIEMASLPSMGALLSDVLKSVKDGKALSVALEPYADLFGRFYLSMLRSGEASGEMSAVLDRLVAHLEESKATRDSVVSALIYPAILLVVAVLSIVVMLAFVVPQFESLFNDMGDSLPTLTRVVINSADFVTAWFWLLAIALTLTVIAVRNWMRSDAGKQKWHARLLRLPLFGGIVFEYEMARFARTLGTLLGNGVPMLRAIDIAIETVENVVLKASLGGLPPAVKAGQRMSVALAESKMFTPMVIQMTRVGEESGAMDTMMLELAKVFDDHVNSGVKRSLTLLEPLLILTMGAVIAVIIIAILMGILSVNDLAV
ncbi:type II secretion system F family protein [Congregibacter litoralis]|uniref:Type II secretion system protein F (GspF) n=1 Tax=Congregibacter litoralis KT71 TaxID=314285 RepID=A4A5M7_9GAMM|nr:type II secretion system F family protein [Congregibacter litoralis]EAQ98324.2 type II secretion system protein F (GspF) [Congregibacter litoralis KT71]